jgi:hypothetical protein
MARSSIPGIIYLIHFDSPLRRGRGGNDGDTVGHYIGWTEGRLTDGLNSYDLMIRMEKHLSGNGARILKALNEYGIGWRPVAAWDAANPLPWLKRPKGCRLHYWPDGEPFRATRFDERRLKNWRNTPRFCPCCLKARAESERTVAA